MHSSPSTQLYIRQRLVDDGNGSEKMGGIEGNVHTVGAVPPEGSVFIARQSQASEPLLVPAYTHDPLIGWASLLQLLRRLPLFRRDW